MSEAVTVLEQHIAKIRKEAQEEIAGIELAIACLRATSTSLPIDRKAGGRTHASRPGQYRGMKKAVALEVYMRERGNDGAIPLADIVRDLLAGNADLGTPDRHERNIILAATNKPRLYVYDRNSRTISLADTADEESKPKPRGKPS